MGGRVIGHGAEAVLRQDGKVVVKTRPVKPYRHPVLDRQLRKSRTRKEAKVLKDLAVWGVPAPRLIEVDEKEGVLSMSFIDGSKLVDVLDANPALARDAGALVARLHNHDCVHGDLTTSNFVLSREGTLHVIDFGLTVSSTRIEDKAVDLHLFKQALRSRHHLVADRAWRDFLKGYHPENRAELLKRLAVVERRGRNKV